MKPTTEALHLKIGTADANSAVTPLYQCSAFTAESPYFYSRKNNPNVVEFEQVCAVLEESDYALAVGTGMSAIFMILDLLPPNSMIVLNKYIYGCSYKLFQRFCKKRGHRLLVKDLSVSADILTLPEKVDLIFFETPTNPFLKTIDIATVSRQVKKSNPSALVVVDNTWATPLYQKPLNFGADISLHSCTKYLSGHSDVMGGIILLNDQAKYEELLQNRFYAGTIMTPYAAWLLRRSLQTFGIRMKRHHDTTMEMVDFLSSLPQVAKLYYPEVDGHQLESYGGIIFFELREDLVDSYSQLTQSVKLFQTGTGMACVTSMIAQPYSGSHASMNEDEKADMGLGKNLVRLCFGMEEPEDLKTDIKNALDKIEEIACIA
jgi:cystathionine gamma-lyase/cystathionine gamma-lyase/homocysteine desulfhydrase